MNITTGLKVALFSYGVIGIVVGALFIVAQEIGMGLFMSAPMEPAFIRLYGALLFGIGVLYFMGIRSGKWEVVKPMVVSGIAYQFLFTCGVLYNFQHTIGGFPTETYLMGAALHGAYFIWFTVSLITNNKKSTSTV